MNHTQHGWIHPLKAALNVSDETHLALLYSGLSEHHTGRYSLLAWGLKDTIITNSWSEIATRFTHKNQWHENAWFGWLGYGMRNDSESLSRGQASPISLPDTMLMQFDHLLRFDHRSQTIEYYHDTTADLRWQNSPAPILQTIACDALASPMSKADYLSIVAHTKNHIEAGDFYQANITRKFTGRLTNEVNHIAAFMQFCDISPAPYSAYIRNKKTHILSSSPECFLSIDETGKMISRPIKGSAPRGRSEPEDKKIRERLLSSTKDNAENRMIVDLMRNDLARSAYAGTVDVTGSAELTSYATVHHLISTITAEKRADVSTIDAVKACFPPGSMTGAPKIAAMEWCNSQEKLERGVYSGAIGWFGGDGTCDLSVVIRTLIIQDKGFEFQVGGGIVADSDPESEWMETLVKARGIARLLNIDESELATL